MSHKLLPHQQRLIEERDQLSERLGKLQAFFKTETFQDLSGNEQVDMRHQSAAMALYLHFLNSRIGRF